MLFMTRDILGENKAAFLLLHIFRANGTHEQFNHQQIAPVFGI
jgi:hypothetical protein